MVTWKKLRRKGFYIKHNISNDERREKAQERPMKTRRTHARTKNWKKNKNLKFGWPKILSFVVRSIFIALWTSESRDSLRYDAARTFLTRYFNVYKCIVLNFVRKSRLMWRRPKVQNTKEESVRQTCTHNKITSKMVRFRTTKCVPHRRRILFKELQFTFFICCFGGKTFTYQMRPRYDHVAARSLNEFGGGKVVWILTLKLALKLLPNRRKKNKKKKQR